MSANNELRCANYMPSYACNAWRNVGAAGCIEFYYSPFVQQLSSPRCNTCKVHASDGVITTMEAKHNTQQRSLIFASHLQISSHPCDSPGVGARRSFRNTKYDFSSFSSATSSRWPPCATFRPPCGDCGWLRTPRHLRLPHRRHPPDSPTPPSSRRSHQLPPPRRSSSRRCYREEERHPRPPPHPPPPPGAPRWHRARRVCFWAPGGRDKKIKKCSASRFIRAKWSKCSRDLNLDSKGGTVRRPN
jgi:hypothetical protein